MIARNAGRVVSNPGKRRIEAKRNSFALDENYFAGWALYESLGFPLESATYLAL